MSRTTSSFCTVVAVLELCEGGKSASISSDVNVEADVNPELRAVLKAPTLGRFAVWPAASNRLSCDRHFLLDERRGVSCGLSLRYNRTRWIPYALRSKMIGRRGLRVA